MGGESTVKTKRYCGGEFDNVFRYENALAWTGPEKNSDGSHLTAASGSDRHPFRIKKPLCAGEADMLKIGSLGLHVAYCCFYLE